MIYLVVHYNEYDCSINYVGYFTNPHKAQDYCDDANATTDAYHEYEVEEVDAL